MSHQRFKSHQRVKSHHRDMSHQRSFLGTFHDLKELPLTKIVLPFTRKHRMLAGSDWRAQLVYPRKYNKNHKYLKTFILKSAC